MSNWRDMTGPVNYVNRVVSKHRSIHINGRWYIFVCTRMEVNGRDGRRWDVARIWCVGDNPKNEVIREEKCYRCVEVLPKETPSE